MAKHLNITFIIGAQINRAAQNEDDKVPQLHNLKGTGKLEEIADMAMLLHWPYFYNKNKDKNEYLVYIAKNRQGQTGFHSLEFHPQFSLFKEKILPEVNAGSIKTKQNGTKVTQMHIYNTESYQH